MRSVRNDQSFGYDNIEKKVVPLIKHPLARTETRPLIGQHAQWRVNLANFLVSNPVQWLFMLLLMCDVTIIMTEMNLAATAVPTVEELYCTPAGAAAIPAPPATPVTPVPHVGRLLLQHHGASAIPHGCEAVVKNVLSHAVHHVEGILYICGILILCTFEVELFLMFVALGKDFFKNKFYVLDVFVVTVSLILETYGKAVIEAIVESATNTGVIQNGNAGFFFEISTLLLISRIWRFARIFHGIGMTVHELDEAVEKKLEAEIDRIKKHECSMHDKLEELRQYLDTEGVAKLDDAKDHACGFSPCFASSSVATV